jgi:hypothetical protein
MALQSQTYANSGNAYYIRGADPIVPGDQGIVGPIEILPRNTSSKPVYYNRFIQDNTTGLSIAEYITEGNELLSDIILRTDNTISLTSHYGPSEATLLIGPNTPGNIGQVTAGANAGLVVGNLASSGTSLQLIHEGSTNTNFIQNNGGGGARLALKPTTGDLVINNSVGSSYITIPTLTNQLSVIQPSTGASGNLTAGGLSLTQGAVSGAIGIFGGAGMTLDSQTNTTIRTNVGAGLTPKTNITANNDGTVTFLSTITAPTAFTSTINNSGNARIASIAVTNNNQGTSVPYSRYYDNYQGNLRYNTIGTSAGAPATASESLEIINVSGGAQTGGIQFYTANNETPTLVKWMGGFLENNVGGGQSEFRLASTVTASMRQIINLSTINNIAIENFGTPVGTIIQFAAWTPPQGYLRCDGTSYATASYSRLYSVIGNTYGGDATNFNVPDCGGKALLGALATYNPGGTALITNYTATAIYQGVVTGVSNPVNITITTGLWLTKSDKPIVRGMIFTPPQGFTCSSYEVEFVVGGNGRNGGINSGFLVMLAGNIYGPITLLQGQTVTFGPNPRTISVQPEYPILGDQNQNAESASIGNMALFQDASQVGAHNHGGAANTNGGLFVAGAPYAGRGATTDVNNGIFHFTTPSYTSGGITYPAVNTDAPCTMDILPYNLGVTMCIKYQ